MVWSGSHVKEVTMGMSQYYQIIQPMAEFGICLQNTHTIKDQVKRDIKFTHHQWFSLYTEINMTRMEENRTHSQSDKYIKLVKTL